MINIKNEILSCNINENGAEIKSLKKGETEYISSAHDIFTQIPPGNSHSRCSATFPQFRI